MPTPGGRITPTRDTGIWLCARRLQQGGFAWPQDEGAAVRLSARQWEWLVAGLPWQRMTAVAQAEAIRVI